MKKHVDAALTAWRQHRADSRVVGFDLAGQEEEFPPERFQKEFEPLHRDFVNITIHALQQLQGRLLKVIDPMEDGIKLIPLCRTCLAKIEVYGLGGLVEPEPFFQIL